METNGSGVGGEVVIRVGRSKGFWDVCYVLTCYLGGGDMGMSTLR